VIPWLISLIDGNAPQWLLVFQYVTVRAMFALGVAFIVSVIWGNRVIAWLRALKCGQQVRDDRGGDAISLKEMHAGKQGTPTMGGLLMLGSLLVAVLLFGDLREPVLLLALAMAVGFASIGFVDDYRKVMRCNSKGLSARGKLMAQGGLGLVFGAVCLYLLHDVTSYSHADRTGTDLLVMPFFKEAVIALGIVYIPFAIFILTATSNAVNLTDGLDGLATGVTITATICFGIVAYLAGRVDASAYLMIPHVRGGGELGVLLAALLGGCFGFLWFNGYPAQVFMGDTGSMMIGGLLGSVALLLKQEFLLLIVGGIFVIEALSVIIQVTSYKLRQKRVFLMSPLHHHFERLGVAESHIIVRFWIVSALLAVAGLSTLKFR